MTDFTWARFSLDKRAPGLFKSDNGKYVTYEAAVAAVAAERSRQLCDMSIAELQAAIGKMQQELTRRVCGDPVGGVGLKSFQCQANRDGDCVHKLCPQLRDGEPHKTGRSCPLAN